MARNLHGLNIVHTVPAHSDPHDLLSGQFHPDVSAQLDLWTNLAFDCDEGACPPNHEEKKYRERARNEEEEDDLTSHGSGPGESALHDGHINVVTGTNVGSTHQGLDLTALLAGFDVPFPAQNVPHPDTITPSLAQLLAHYSTSNTPPAFPGHPMHPTGLPNAPQRPSVAAIRTSPDESSPTGAKRARGRKASVSTVGSPGGEETTGVSASEDKRRRNTAASARFRLKKKEREAALESKAKELEARVNELERECEGLRRENGWLKGLVVGVTGAAQGPTGTKRSRDESENV